MRDGTDSRVCGYKSPRGFSCQREVSDGDFCVFHQGCNRKLDEEILPNPQFQSALDLLLEQKDGNWDGFVFPSIFRLPNRIEFPVYLRWARFTVFGLNNTTFEDAVDFSDSIFLGNVIFRRVTFDSSATYDRCRFEACFELQKTHFKQSVSFHRAEFSKRAVFMACFSGTCNLNETTPREDVNFAGWSETFLRGSGTVSLPQSTKLTAWQNIKMQFQPIQAKMNRLFHQEIRRFKTQDKGLKVFRVFDGDGKLQDVFFVKPDQVSFSEADLSRVDFRGTNLRGVHFLGVKWWQPKLGRNGLCEELSIRLSNDGPHRVRNLPALEQTCRNVRVSLEESRDFNIASDFYIAEMEALRAQLSFSKRYLFSVTACYRLVSYYGTSVGAGLLVLGCLFVSHLGLTLFWIHSSETITQLVGRIPIDALRTFKILSLQMAVYGEQTSLPIKQH